MFSVVIGIYIIMAIIAIKAGIATTMSCKVIEAVYEYNTDQLLKVIEGDTDFVLMNYEDTSIVKLIFFDWTFQYKNTLKNSSDYELCKPYIKKVFRRRKNDD